MIIKKILLILAILASPLVMWRGAGGEATLFAQNISITSFEYVQNDMTAMQHGTSVTDHNGERCALIKVSTLQKGFTFDLGSSLGVVKTVDHPETNEIWLYVPVGARRISVFHPTLGEVRDYSIPCNIEPGRTYLMKLKTANVTVIVEEQATSQYVVFQVQPTTAIVEINGDMLDVASDGTAMKYMPFGSYSYNVQAANYHPEAGTIEVNDPVNKQVINVNLKPAFGWIEVTGNASLDGAVVYIDNQLIGNVPVKSGILASGPHTVKIARSMYSPFSQQVTVSDNETTTLSPSLSADFANLTFSVGGNAEIWINGEKKGNGTWTGALGTGEYKVESKLASHRTSTKSLSVSPAQTGQTITLDPPTPIYGKINVAVSPAMADIYLDGEKKGQTPMILQNVLIGQHNIKVSKSGYGDYNTTVSVQEAQTADVSTRLADATNVSLNITPLTASLTIDGQNYSSTQGIYSLAFGSHTITMSAEGYKPFSRTIEVAQGGSNSFSLAMEALLEDKTYRVKGVSFTMIAVKGGTFRMGATSEQGSDAESDETPVHQVTLSDFKIGETEVTQALWKAVKGSNPSYYSGDNLPVERVSWDDCQTFIRKLNSLTGQTFRLPTEAEWEYAARGGNKSRGYKYSGSNTIDDVAWYYSNSSSETHAVKTKQPNELGIYDMSGNVWEWCSDWYGSYSSSSQTNPTGASSGSLRVFRGGSWDCLARHCRSSYRRSSAPDDRYFSLGLRLVLSE